METFDLFGPEASSDRTCSAADSPASHSVMPGSEQARTTTVISGRKCAVLLASCDPLGPFLLDELDALRKDAERYRWLRDCGIARSPEDRDAWDTIESAESTPDEIDAAIDRARGAI